MSYIASPATEAQNTSEPLSSLQTSSAVNQTIPTILEPSTTGEDTMATRTLHPSGASAEEPSFGATSAADPMSSTAEQAVRQGSLGYKAPGVLNSFRYSKKYFWFGDEPVPYESLDSYLRGEKAEIAHPTAAWSSQTGKGLLYFAKYADLKSMPTGVLNLSEISDLRKDGPVGFAFNLHGQKHAFQAGSWEERDSWFSSLETESDKARTAKDEIVGRAGYTDTLTHLGKSSALDARSSARGTSVSRKSTDVFATGGVVRDSDSTSSNSSSDRNKRGGISRKSKSRSVSRGKRASIFGGLIGKKEEHEEKKEHKKDMKAEESTERTAERETSTSAVAAGTLDAEAVAARVLAAPTEGEAILGTTPATEPNLASSAFTRKPTKRTSVFGNIINKITSPTVEKKEHEVGPIVPPKDTSSSAAAVIPGATDIVDTPATMSHETAAVPSVTGAAATTPTATTPLREKEGFFGRLLNKDRTRTTTNGSSVLASPGDESSAAAAIASPDGGHTSAGLATPDAKEKRRGSSFFATFGGSTKKDRVVDTDNTVSDEAKTRKAGLGGLFRRPSKVEDHKEIKKENVVPASVPETAEAPKITNGTSSELNTSGAAGVAENSMTSHPVNTNGHAMESRTPAVQASA